MEITCVIRWCKLCLLYLHLLTFLVPNRNCMLYQRVDVQQERINIYRPEQMKVYCFTTYEQWLRTIFSDISKMGRQAFRNVLIQNYGLWSYRAKRPKASSDWSIGWVVKLFLIRLTGYLAKHAELIVKAKWLVCRLLGSGIKLRSFPVPPREWYFPNHIFTISQTSVFISILKWWNIIELNSHETSYKCSTRITDRPTRLGVVVWFVCGWCNDAVSSSDKIASND